MDIITQNLLSCNLETRLLEACDWDEEEVEKLLEKVSNIINSKQESISKEYATGGGLIAEIKQGLADNATPTQVEIIVEIVNLETKKWFKEIAQKTWIN